jgi:hypothetical protein
LVVFVCKIFRYQRSCLALTTEKKQAKILSIHSKKIIKTCVFHK